MGPGKLSPLRTEPAKSYGVPALERSSPVGREAGPFSGYLGSKGGSELLPPGGWGEGRMEPPVAVPPARPPCPREPPGLWVSLWPLLSGTDARGGRLDGAAGRRMAERGLTGQPQDARAWQAGLGATAAEALCGLILFLEPSNHPAAPAAREVDCPRSQARHPPSPAAEPGGRRALGSLTTLPEGTAAPLLVLLCVVTRKRRQKHSSPPFFSTEGCGQGLHTGLHFHSIKIFF